MKHQEEKRSQDDNVMTIIMTISEEAQRKNKRGKISLSLSLSTMKPAKTLVILLAITPAVTTTTTKQMASNFAPMPKSPSSQGVSVIN